MGERSRLRDERCLVNVGEDEELNDGEEVRLLELELERVTRFWRSDILVESDVRPSPLDVIKGNQSKSVIFLSLC